MGRKRPSRRFEVLNDFSNHHMRYLQASLVRTWYFLWSWEKGASGQKPGMITVSQAQIASACGLSIGTAQRAVQQLIQMGYLCRISGGVHRQVSVYYIGCPLLEEVGLPRAQERAGGSTEDGGSGEFPGARQTTDRCAPDDLQVRAGAHLPTQGPYTAGSVSALAGTTALRP